MPNFINIIEMSATFCSWTYKRTYRQTFETLFIRSTQNSRPKN